MQPLFSKSIKYGLSRGLSDHEQGHQSVANRWISDEDLNIESFLDAIISMLGQILQPNAIGKWLLLAVYTWHPLTRLGPTWKLWKKIKFTNNLKRSLLLPVKVNAFQRFIILAAPALQLCSLPPLPLPLGASSSLPSSSSSYSSTQTLLVVTNISMSHV